MNEEKIVITTNNISVIICDTYIP